MYPDVSGVRVAKFLVLCVVFCRLLFVVLSFCFYHCIACPSAYDVLLPVWYIQIVRVRQTNDHSRVNMINLLATSLGMY